MHYSISRVGFEVLAASTRLLLFWVVTPCSLVGRYRRFGRSYFLHLQGWMLRKYVNLRRWYILSIPYVGTVQKKKIDITSAVYSFKKSYDSVTRQVLRCILKGGGEPVVIVLMQTLQACIGFVCSYGFSLLTSFFRSSVFINRFL